MKNKQTNKKTLYSKADSVSSSIIQKALPCIKKLLDSLALPGLHEMKYRGLFRKPQPSYFRHLPLTKYYKVHYKYCLV